MKSYYGVFKITSVVTQFGKYSAERIASLPSKEAAIEYCSVIRARHTDWQCAVYRCVDGRRIEAVYVLAAVSGLAIMPPTHAEPLAADTGASFV